MSNQYNTDGLLIILQMNKSVNLNALESIENTIAFDVRDWSTDRRSAWIYQVVFGDDGSDIDNEEWEKLSKDFGWDDEDRERAKRLHEQWEKAKTWLNSQEDKP